MHLQASSVRDAIAEIDAQMPQLNEEKKMAVAERWFKEASRIVVELKRLSDDREKKDRELSQVLSSIDSAEADIAKQTAALEAKREALSAMERKTDESRMEVLRDALRLLAGRSAAWAGRQL
jgi:chromosome segregation ATPase